MNVTRLGELRKAVLDSWTLTYQRETAYGRRLESAEQKWSKKKLMFTRYKVDEKEALVMFGGRKYRVERPAPEETQWVPFAVLLEQFEEAVRADERGERVRD